MGRYIFYPHRSDICFFIQQGTGESHFMKQGLMPILFLIFITSLCDTINQLFLKSAINSLNASVPPNIFKVFRFIIKLITVPRVWFSFAFSILSLCVWLLVLSKAELNFAFSIDSMHYILIALSSKFILREKVGLKRTFGTFFIIIGIILVSLS